ncbi:hypothetical protein ANN_22575 [Periplaneta americana]|uniref:RNA-directed DNA polymerase n=1 Tax=Periplaneta americana TaxID=6978 RepID=A0ABQ8S8I1_PERAM|nr:hypothetical protein ANN_22575 [Periplaneta americana]
MSGKKRFSPREESRYLSSRTQGPRTPGSRTHGVHVVTCVKCPREGHRAKERRSRVNAQSVVVKTTVLGTAEADPVAGPSGQGSEDPVDGCHNSTLQLVSNQVKGKINALIDTGSELLLIQRNVVLVQIEETNIQLKGVTGDTLLALGQINLNFEVKDERYQQLCYIVDQLPQPYDCILGQDFLQKNEVTLVFAPSQCQVHIPPRTERLVKIPLKGKGNVIILRQEIESETSNIIHVHLVRNPEKTNEPFSKKQENRHAKLNTQLRLDHIVDIEEKESIRQICHEYVDIFHLPGDTLTATTAAKHHIPTSDVPHERAIHVKPYRIPHVHKEEVNKQVSQMLEDGIVAPSSSPWNFPILVVPKKLDASGEKKWRICVDFRELNDVTIGDSYPLSNIQDILDKLGRARFFSALDCASGYLQIPIAEDDRMKTAFSTESGHYEYTRMPKFIKDFSELAKPLTELLKKDVAFKWTDVHENAVQELKEKIMTPPILRYPDFTKPFILTCDASNNAIGCVLSQGTVGQDLPVAFGSRTLNQAERNYSTIEKELLAIVWGCKHFRPYLLGRSFTILTDHRPLTWIFSVKDPSSRPLRWRLLLEEYQYTVQYKAGKQNTNADALSRNPQLCALISEEELTDERKNKIIKQIHVCPVGGHQGIHRTLDRLKLYVNWPNMKSEVEEYIRTCPTCQKNKMTRPYIKQELEITDTQPEPWIKLALDVVGPLPLTEQGHKYILTCQDNLTKYLIAVPIENQEVETVANALVRNVCLVYGIPQIILTDQGANCMSNVFKQQTQWDDWVPLAVFAYNTTPHTVTKFTPFELLFGSIANLPGELQKGKPGPLYNYEDLVQGLRFKLKASYEIARNNIVKAKEIQKEQYDTRRANAIKLEVGMQVLMQNESVKLGTSKKLNCPWLGPYEITKVYDNNNIEISLGKNKTKRIHTNRVKLFSLLSGTMCKSIFVWILTGLVARAVGLDFTYTKMEESSGLYFDARGEVQLSATDWKLVTYINIEQVKESLRFTKEHVQAATSFCEGLKNQTWYGMTDCVSFRSYAFSRVRRLGKLRDVLADFTTPSDEFHDRQKRGVLNFVGQISKILFGTLAEDDAEYYSDKISALENEQKEFLRISKEQMIVVKSTIASFNSTFKEVQRNEKILQSGLNKLAKHMDTVSEQLVNETYIISITQTIAEHSLQIQRSMDDCERTFNIILDALVHAQDGILQPQVITPSQIRKLMRSEQLPVGLGYPVTSTSQELLQLIKPKIFIHEKYLIYVLHIPLTTSTRYQLFQVIPFPKRTNSTSDKYIYLEPSREFILSEPTRQAYAKLTEKNVEDCLHIDDTRMICKQDFPVINFQAGEDCEASLLHPSTAAIPTSCKQRVLELRNTLWLKLHGNEWLHVSPQPEVVSYAPATTLLSLWY